MYKYVKNIQENGKCLEVANGTNTDFYKSIGMVRKDVEQSEVDGCWYLADKCPHYTDEEKEAQKQQKEDEEKDQALEQAIEELGKEMLKAQMCENKEWIAEIKAQYQTLMNGEE